MKLTDLIGIVIESDNEDETPDKAAPPGKIGDLVTTAQAAKILGVSMARVREFKSEGRLKPHSEPQPGQRDTLYKLSTVEAFKSKAREITGRPPEGESSKKKD